MCVRNCIVGQRVKNTILRLGRDVLEKWCGECLGCWEACTAGDKLGFSGLGFGKQASFGHELGRGHNSQWKEQQDLRLEKYVTGQIMKGLVK